MIMVRSTSTMDTAAPDVEPSTEFRNQVAGHSNMKCGVGGKLIYKPLVSQELAFYEYVRSSYRRLLPFLARCFGSIDASLVNGELPVPASRGRAHSRSRSVCFTSDSPGDVTVTPSYPPSASIQHSQYLMLQNLTCGMTLPCLMDIKMGQRQHGDDASDEKKKRMSIKVV